MITQYRRMLSAAPSAATSTDSSPQLLRSRYGYFCCVYNRIYFTLRTRLTMPRDHRDSNRNIPRDNRLPPVKERKSSTASRGHSGPGRPQSSKHHPVRRINAVAIFLFTHRLTPVHRQIKPNSVFQNFNLVAVNDICRVDRFSLHLRCLNFQKLSK